MVNGERSYKLTNSSSGGATVILEKIVGDLKEGDSFTLSAKVLVKNTRTVLYIQGGIEGGSSSNISSISIPSNNSFENASITVTLESDLDYIHIPIMPVDEGITYVDDVHLTKN